MSSRPETPSQTTGAHRRHRAPVQRGRAAAGGGTGPAAGRRRLRPNGTLPSQPPAHYEPYLDGLFTYCLSVLCEHDAAAVAVGDVLAVAERQRARLRNPELRRPWLYALARWACLRTLADGRPASVKASAEVAARRRGELSALAWPEAAGTTPEQREVLELAVRHQLAPHEVALVVGLDPDATRALLAQAACEVERTRAALAVVELGNCPAVARLAGDARVLLGTALRRELVHHVDVCSHCRLTAERAVAAGPWPGLATTAATAVLATIEAPRSAAYAALLHAMRGGVGRARQGTPRFDRRGFPMDLKERTARRARMRHRAVTSTVVAAVVAAPVLALWAAYHGAPLAPGQKGEGSFTAADGDGLDGFPYEKAGAAGSAERGRSQRGGHGRLSVSVASASPEAPDASPSAGRHASASPSSRATKGADADGDHGGRPAHREGRLVVAARTEGDVTVITLTAEGDRAVRWSAARSAPWLHLSRRHGMLRPGDSTTITVSVDRDREPVGAWTARIVFDPSGGVVTIHGTGTPSQPPSPDPSPRPSTSPTPDPSPSGSPSGEPSGSPSS
ncbi:BACON domain-containing protein [Streptomyces sp. MI02-7b]|uniref:BACON domain-containing protein n=1 Tax=Streptomyces sp. MI02-7b TaxID=462941 RepID=UPI0029B19F51|nr:sigma-70 family RNA polymerase sigma factor [Streptomyces sp. MI02-7b]MDX3076580.1 sigma-70 family RNA polymerase sigma factor [Streptomyces sp. MI02-7b]